MSYNSTFKPRKKSMRQAYAEKVKRNGMNRSKTPHKALKFAPGAQSKPKGTLPRKAMKRQSVARQREMTRYYEERAEWLKTRPACGICLVLGNSAAPATEVHHSRGRIGRLLRDQRFWVPSCFGCRDIPHTRPQWAREVGILSSAKDWNTYPRE